MSYLVPTITPEPVDGAIVGLSCALVVCCMVIAILSGAIIRHFIRRRRCVHVRVFKHSKTGNFISDIFVVVDIEYSLCKDSSNPKNSLRHT